MIDPLPAPHTHVVVTEFDGGESVLVDLNTRRYYQLNETATLIWRGLAKGSSKADIVGSLTSAYHVTDEDADRSVDAVLQQLKAHRLLAE
jgi:hypothetical protein